MKRFLTAGLLAGFLLFGGTARAEMPDIDIEYEKFTLDNGLTYYIRANKRPENRAELRLVVNAGAVLEDDDQRGMAHLLEHLWFRSMQAKDSDGVLFIQEITAVVESPMNLRRYPFDRQKFQAIFELQGKKLAFTSSGLEAIADIAQLCRDENWRFASWPRPQTPTAAAISSAAG